MRRVSLDNLPSKKYGVIYADPPWLFRTRSDKGKEKSKNIKQEIAKKDIYSKLNDDFLSK